MRRRRARREAEALAEHFFETQVLPVLKAQKLRDDGIAVDVAMAYTGPDQMEGLVKVSCVTCGRTAQMPAEQVPPGTQPMCPPCVAKL